MILSSLRSAIRKLDYLLAAAFLGTTTSSLGYSITTASAGSTSSIILFSSDWKRGEITSDMDAPG